MEIDVNVATRDEMVEYARTELGLDVKGNTSKGDAQQLVAKHTGQTVSAEFAPPPAKAVAVSRKTAATLKTQKKVTILIDEQQGEQDHVYVGINGVSFTMRRGVEVEVPEAVVGVLEQAQETHYSTVKDSQGRRELVAKTVPSYPFRVIR